jgi:hypothetical protein
MNFMRRFGPYLARAASKSFSIYPRGGCLVLLFPLPSNYLSKNYKVSFFYNLSLLGKLDAEYY